MIKGLTLRPAMPDIAAVSRSLLGVVAIALVALYFGPPASATAAAAAGAVAGATALQDSPRGRIPLVVGVSLVLGSAVLLGALTSAYSVLFVVVAAMWGFAAAMPWALGVRAGSIAAVSTALLVIAPPVAPTVSSTVGVAALVVAGGLLQAGIIAVWPQRRWRLQRDALAVAYRSLAADARRLADGAEAPVSTAAVDTEPLVALRTAFTLVDGQTRRRPAEYRDWYLLPERIAATLTALAGPPGVANVLTAAADTLEAVAEPRRSRDDADAAIRRVDGAVGDLTGPEAAVAKQLSTHLHEAAAVRLGDFVPSSPDAVRLRRPELRTSVGSAIALMRSHLDRHSPVLRHAVRLGVTMAAGCAVARYADVAHGYWIALTVLMVLRPETAHTYTRCAGRLLGNVVGVVLASSVLVLGPPGVVSAVLAVGFIGVSYAAAGLGYLAFSAALTAATVFLINIDRTPDPASVRELLFATVVGGAMAVLAHVLLPDDGLTRLSQRAGELLKTEIDYAATVIRAYVHELDHPSDALAAAWERAFRARAAFEAAAGATRLETRELRHWLQSYRAALNAVTTSCTTLEANFPGNPSTAWSSEFVLAVDEYVESLCGEPPTPASPWTVDTAELAAAEQRLRDAVSVRGSGTGPARVLVAEVATITRHLSVIAVSPGPTAAR